jgi:hypothetical protein
MSDLASPVVNADQRAWHYFFSDGLTNVVTGIGCLLLSFCVLYPPHWPLKPLQLAAWGIALWLYATTILRHRHVVEWLKTKTTYPRTGYAETPPDAICPFPLAKLSMHGKSVLGNSRTADELGDIRRKRRKTVYLMLGLILISAVVELVALRHRWVWIAAGLIVSAAMILARKQFHMSWIAPVGFAVLGLLMTFFHPSLQVAPSLFLVGWGVIFVLDGTFTLIRYLLLNPQPKAVA